MADPALLDAVEVKMRRIEGEAGQTVDHALDATDLGALLISLRLLVERGSFAVAGWGRAARWPERSPRIAPVENLQRSLLRLRRLGFVAFAVEAGTARVTYGPRVGEIARTWGIDVREDGEQRASGA